MTNIFDPSRWSMYPPQTFVSGDYYAFKSDDMSVSFPLSSYAIKFCASQFGNGTRPHRLNRFHWMQWSQDRNTRSPQEQLQHHHGLSENINGVSSLLIPVMPKSVSFWTTEFLRSKDVLLTRHYLYLLPTLIRPPK